MSFSLAAAAKSPQLKKSDLTSVTSISASGFWGWYRPGVVAPINR